MKPGVYDRQEQVNSRLDKVRRVASQLPENQRELLGDVIEKLARIAEELHHPPDNSRDGNESISAQPSTDSHMITEGEIARVPDGHLPLEQEKAQSISRESLYHTIFQEASLGIKVINLEGQIVDSNPAFQELVGYPAQDLHGRSFNDFTHPADIQETQRLFDELIAGKVSNYRLEKRYVRGDGEVSWVRLVISLVRDEEDQPLYAIGMAENINERKVIEAELVEVHTRMVDSGEKERLHLAQELHDGPLQDLLGLIYKLNPLLSDLPQGENHQLLKEAIDELQDVMSELRAICGELRPPTLAPFGLAKAIRSHIEHIRKRRPDLKITLRLMDDGHMLSERIRLALFRIYQQSVMNTIRHAEANHLHIHFEFDAEEILLEIRDDGQGFKLPKRWVELVRQGHFGLVGAAERAEAIGGWFQIESEPNEGTNVQVVVPMTAELQIAPKGRLSVSMRNIFNPPRSKS
jgi:PAS domain S-box-containing protein